MRNKRELLKLNVIPEGKEAWLNYQDYFRLERLFEAVGEPTPGPLDDNYTELHRFLTAKAGLNLSTDKAAIHFNAFTLLRRGYVVEEITAAEYTNLVRLLDGLEQPAKNDMDLYDFGGHRDLYTYLTRQMGLFVPPGRGPAWHRATALVEKYRRREAVPS